MKFLIFDDDIQSYHQIRNILEDYDSQHDVIGPFTTVEQAREYLSQHKDIDIIISEVVLGESAVFEAMDYAPDYVPVIFVSAHTEYALQAFSYYSLSYLQKPIDEVELTKAVAKAMRLRKVSPLLTPQGGWTRQDDEQSRFVVKTFKGERIIHISTIRYIVSEQKNTYVKLLDGSSYRIDMPLEVFATQLDSSLFMRVNRKYIVPLEQVIGTERIENGKMQILLKGENAPDIIVSRTRKSEVCEWLHHE